jgi:asparagine synthase (glutamine-hydrolysing)
VCGVVAIVSRPGVDAGLVGRLTAALAHRGPDGEGIRLLDDGRVALGHRRLAILDLSPAGLQPMSDAAGEVWITYNGEIFNYVELREALHGRGHRFRSATDTEVLLALYREEGMRMLRRLRGMYAFVLHDTRTRETFYARDPVGIKPLYLRRLPDGVALASEPAVLGRLGPNTLDLLPVLRSLMYLYPAGESFGVREIRRVLPGEVGRVDPAGTITPLPFGPVLPDGRGPGADELSAGVDDLEAALRHAVREHMTSDVPVGIAFSAGLDSSLVARLAADETTKPVRLYSFFSRARTREERLDDHRAITRGAASLGLRLSVVEASPAFLADLDRVVGAVGEPVADPAAIAFLAIAERARAEGHYVLLSGHGADELLAGYRRHLVASRLLAHPGAARALALAGGSLPGDLGRLSQVFREPRRHWLALLPSVVRPCELPPLLSPDLVPASLEPLLAPITGVAARSDGAPALRRGMHLDFHTYLPDQNLNYLDKIGMAHGVEGRVPFLTPPVLSVCGALAERDLVAGARGKLALRRLGGRLLPPEIVGRPKRAFGIPLRQCLHREWDAIRSRLTSPSAPSRFLWNPALLATLGRSAKPPLPPLRLYTMLVIDGWLGQWRLP